MDSALTAFWLSLSVISNLSSLMTGVQTAVVPFVIDMLKRQQDKGDTQAQRGHKPHALAWCSGARAEWVTFSDDDDTMEPDALEKLYALRLGTDIVVGFTVLPSKRLGDNTTIEDCRRAQISGGVFLQLHGLSSTVAA